VVNRLQYPAMSIFNPLKHKPLGRPKASQLSSKTENAGRAGTNSAVRSERSPALEDEDDAIANLKNSYARAEAEKRENAYGDGPDCTSLVEADLDSSSTLIDSVLPTRGGKTKPGKVKLLGPPATTVTRSHPGSPALSAIASPSLGPTTTTAQDRLRQHRFPIIHELAVQEMTFQELFHKYNEGTEQEFSSALNKVADFDNDLQRWALRKVYWKDLDVFEYDYETKEHRQKAIDHAIKQYDKMRLGASDPLWQKLLPKSERGKGVCLSKLQAAIASKAASTKAGAQKTDASSLSGADSEKDDSASSTAKRPKGGEPMSRSSSQTLKKKPSASEAQAKRLLANPKKTPATSAKASPKVSPTKPTTTSKAAGSKGGRVLSKEFISDSDSDDDEVPLSSSMPKTKTAATPASVPKVAERLAERAKVAEKPKEPAAPKTKATLAARPAAKEKDTIRAQVVAKPIKPPTKRRRDDDDDDSSSSGTPLSKRIKPGVKAQSAAVVSNKQRATSDISQGSRGNGSNGPAVKSKNTSPVKSSPLASSPPTNASDLDHDRPVITPRGRERDRDIDRDTIVSRAGSSTSTGSSIGPGEIIGSGGPNKKRPADNSSREGSAKRQRLSEEILNKAHKFKQFYSRYETLHKEIRASEDPHPDRVADLMDMHARLKALKREIYEQAPVEA